MTWFRRTPPPYTRMDPHEAKVASAWGHTEESWMALPDQQRVKARENYLKAPRYVG